MKTQRNKRGLTLDKCRKEPRKIPKRAIDVRQGRVHVIMSRVLVGEINNANIITQYALIKRYEFVSLNFYLMSLKFLGHLHTDYSSSAFFGDVG